MLKRPQRNLLMILSSIAVIWLLLRLMPWNVAVGVGLAIFAIALILMAIAWRFLMGRYRLRKRDWPKAVDHYQRFEQMLLTRRIGTVVAPLFLGVYTHDAIAVTRNQIADALIQQRKLEEAEGWLKSALQRDPLYPVPYIYLGTIAALRGQLNYARQHFRKAVELGYNPRRAQETLARLLASSDSAKH
jgi:tetratricopeptide (TPR) repeat protein